jgi:hypothetical protein
MATGNDPILDNLGVAHLGSPKALLGSKGRILGEFREFAMRGSMLRTRFPGLLLVSLCISC